jgi:hypothetical protein
MPPELRIIIYCNNTFFTLDLNMISNEDKYMQDYNSSGMIFVKIFIWIYFVLNGKAGRAAGSATAYSRFGTSALNFKKLKVYFYRQDGSKITILPVMLNKTDGMLVFS